MNSQKGQSILEIIITLSILALVLGGLVIVIVNSLKNSQFSKNQAQATKLAEEGLDTVRSMKSNDQCSLYMLPTLYYWVNRPQPVWGNSALYGYYIIDPSANPSGCNLTKVATNVSQVLPGNVFSRQIILDQDSGTGGNGRIRVTSIVSWNDISGVHESKLVTVLAP